MNDEEIKKEENKKKGLIPFFSKLFGGGSRAGSTLGGAAVRGGASFGGAAARGAGGLAGLFSTKAGIVGMILGGATIAAGIGVLYNFIGPSSSGKAYQGLFQDSYYQEQAQRANSERAGYGQAGVDSKSSIDMFKEQAQKEGLAMDADEEGKDAEGAKDGEAEAEGEGSSDMPGAVDGAPGYGGAGGGKLQASLGFGGAGSKLQTSGGMSGGIGQSFSPVYRPSGKAASGKGSKMTGGRKASISGRKYNVKSKGGKGAFGQAKFAKKSGAKAAYSSLASDARVGSGVGFDTTRPQTGDVATPGGGVGLDGAGVDPSGNALGGVNDPSLNQEDSSPGGGGGGTKEPEKEKDNPWQKMEDIAMYGMLISAVLIFATKILANKAKAAMGTPAFAALYMAAKVCAYLAMAAAAAVLLAGIGFMTGKNIFGGEDFDPQKWTGIMYAMAGGMLIYQAYQALSGLSDMGDMNSNAMKAGAGIEDAIQKQAAIDSYLQQPPATQKLIDANKLVPVFDDKTGLTTWK